MNRGELLAKAFNGEFKEGDTFKCENKGRVIRFDGTTFEYLEGYKRGSKLYLALTNVTEHWVMKPRTTRLHVQVPQEFMDALREHQLKHGYDSLSAVVQKSGNLLMGVEG
ncbi:hypothetical protein [Alkalicoccobacillus gibsonii]|uniref:hypothetical protein n=1 Tax=Alkalicoccobacillus gibsonii TaxID=79881 RepID=UPI003516C5A7